MSRWAKKYTDEQREAVVRGVLDGGLSCPKAVKAAAAGELEGAKAFEIPITTAQDLVRKERQRRADEEAERAATHDPGKAARDLVTDLLKEARVELKRLRDGSVDSPSRWGELREAANAIKAIDAAAKQLLKAPGSVDSGGEEERPAGPASLVERLASQDEAETATTPGPSMPNPKGTKDSGGAPAENAGAASPATENSEGQEEKGVRVEAEGNGSVAERVRAVLEGQAQGGAVTVAVTSGVDH